MRILVSACACVLVASSMFGTAASSDVLGKPRPIFSRAGVRPVPGRPISAQRGRAEPSCAGGTNGNYAFDDGTKFTTNFGTNQQFGSGNLAYGGQSGTFEGESNTVCDYDAAIFAGSDNVVDAGSSESAMSSVIVGGNENLITLGKAFIGAGGGNRVSADSGFIGAGLENIETGDGSFIGDGGELYGDAPNIQVSGTDSFVGDGDENDISTNASFVGSGGFNNIAQNGDYGSIVGGMKNTVTGGYASVLDGYENTASGEYSSVLGGYDNTSKGLYATVAGGYDNFASGTLTFAAGYHADAVHSGSFVWSDYHSGSAFLKDSAVDQFLVRASGGTFVYSNEDATSGVELLAGSGAWASLSDRNAKTEVAPLDEAAVLAKVMRLPVSTWRYKSESGVRHAGPMAQDFYAAFGVGEDDKHITSIDEDGVALAAIKALSRQLGDLRGQVGSLRGEVGALHAENAVLKSRLATLDK